MLSKIKSSISFKARNFGHVRFEEPIVVFESDDWGKIAGQPEGDYPTNFGTRTDWSYDQLENKNELEDLFDVLKSYKNDFERPPVFTANFIVANPDFRTTKDINYEKLILKTIDVGFPYLVPVWKKGIKKRVFYPQYHGILHHNFQLYQAALKHDEKVRFLFDQGINGGLENFDETKYALYSEYQNCQTAAEDNELDSWISEGLHTFESIFGYRSKTAVSPNYVMPPGAIAAFAQTDLKYLQACNKILWLKDGIEQKLNYCQGTTLQSGLVALSRNHKFEPCRGKKEWKAAFSATAAKSWLQRGIPAVIDTHRMNYVGKFAENSLAELRILLDSLREFPDIRFLTSSELGEAITQKGSYTCVFTGEKKQLTLKDNFLRKRVRGWVQ